jgi:molecular chaperone HscB
LLLAVANYYLSVVLGLVNNPINMHINLTQNYFEVFGLPVQYEVDLNSLATRFRELQAQVHPDKFINGTDEERRIAVQTTGFLNEAKDTLTDPRLRAHYLLSLKGEEFEFEIEGGTTNDPVFLMQQMEIRESIEDAEDADDPFEELDQLRKIIKLRQQDVENSFKQNYDAGDYKAAKQAALKLRFCERIFGEIKRVEERLDDY